MNLFRLFVAFVLSFIAVPAAPQTIAQPAPTAHVVASAGGSPGAVRSPCPGG